MAGETNRGVPARRPVWSDWFDALSRESPLFGGDHPIRIEEGREKDSYVVRAELPGVDPEKDVEITVDEGMLTIHAERTEESSGRDGRGHRTEFRYGALTRAVRLPRGVVEDRITAEYDKGVLTVRAPVEEAERPSGRRVEVTRGG
ncbi:Hsp20/alpha crystallin family protein [Streptomyces calidiresistens]|uniref:Hsp20 family protein n=1 Tax=Streptomyces calidiresistens TaxID=1485586 RepID=A0A7W3XZC9_9ACTN|nr:Hsp20/alpha crystallin family protein [Streptomyces calidiresistens]MBB0232807.1 Hsp20 family protein [Streptomyces calidiresistens]